MERDDTLFGSTLGPSEAIDATADTAAGATTGGTDYVDLITIDPDHYLRGGQLAKGGMGRIVVARDRRLGRVVAIKELLTPTLEMRRRFEREARITARLQHPSIVNLLEAGAWPNGEPFYAMKLVAGESLERAAARARTVEQRLALLPAVIAAVDALAYAHDQRVIHRDLKPHNVMVGAFGETVVIDWGLAKDLAATDEREDAADPYRTSAAPVETVAGSVIGTPAYMAPEQARCEPLDARADVYALGAILYHVLTGRPPYRGGSAREILDQVVAGPPAPVDQLAPGIAPDLVTIVSKALAHDRQHRYPSAAELAADLKRFQTGQLVAAHRYSAGERLRRWVARHRAAVIVGTVLAIALAATAVVSVRRIVHERDLAESRRRQAETVRRAGEQLVDFQLVELEHRLDPIGRLDVMAGLGEGVLAYYQQVAAVEAVADPDALDRRIQALFVLTDVELSRGELVAAMQYAELAREMAERLVALTPEDVAHWRRIIGAHWRAGDIHRGAFRVDAALAEYDLALAAAVWNAERSTDPQDQRNVATVCEAIGNAKRDRGDLAGALTAYRASVAGKEAVLALRPGDLDVEIGLAEACANTAVVAQLQGDLTGARALIDRGLAVAAAAAQAAPDDHDAGIIVGQLHGLVGDIAAARGALADAEAAYRTSAGVLDALIAIDPDHTRTVAEAARAHVTLALLLEARGSVQDARRELAAALQRRTDLADRHPDNPELARDVASIREKLGAFELRRGNLEPAAQQFAAAAQIAARLAAASPDKPELQRDHEVVLELEGDVALQRGDAGGARALYEQSRAIAVALAAIDPSNRTWQRDLVGSHLKAGDALIALDRPADAAAAYRDGADLAATLASGAPDDGEALDDLATSQLKLGDGARASGSPDALQHYRESLASREAALATGSDSPGLRARLALSLARVAGSLGAAPEAHDLLVRARDLLAALPADALGPDERALRDEIDRRLARR